MMNSTQADRAIKVTTPLDDDVLLLYRMTAREELGRLFEFSLELLSHDNAIALPDVLGQPMTVSAALPAGGERFLNGIVSRFSHVGSHGRYARYRASLVPWFWCLTRTADCRIFQQQTVPDIIKSIFREHGFTDFDDQLTGTYREWEYCVQYRETDFNFISRLMEQEGIYYYFLHEDGKHTMVLADDYASHNSVPNYAEIPYFPPDQHGRREREHVFDWSVSQEVQSGAYVLNDYDFERPKADLLVKSVVARQHAHSDFEVYDYPGEYLLTSEGDGYARRRIEEQQAEYERGRGTADAYGLQVGALFTLSDHPREDQNREYLIVSATQELQNNAYETGDDGGGPTWQAHFEAMDSQQPFRSPRRSRKPIIQGPQTAVVVGKSGEEIWTDKYGRIKVQFHWDRYGQADENSSCWVRVAQLWAGKTWGAMHIPRIGQEVIVEFLEGDPDRPIVTGRVYNADEMPPYNLPENQTQSGIKSRSSKGANQQNFNELRFEDKLNEEQVYFHAEKDFERVVENNDTLRVGFDKSDDGDQVIEIYNNQQLTVGQSGCKDGSQTLTVWKDRTKNIETGDETVAVKEGKRTTTIAGDDTLTIKSGNQAITVESGDHSLSVDAGKSVIEAAQSILLTVGGSSIKIEPYAITIKSVSISIEGDASVDVKSPLTTCEGSGTLTLKGGMTMIN